MQTIHFTQLRSQSKLLKEALEAGEIVDLVHRSRIVAEIRPKPPTAKVFNAQKVKKLVDSMNLPQLTLKQREENYRNHLEQKYGKGVPGY